MGITESFEAAETSRGSLLLYGDGLGPLQERFAVVYLDLAALGKVAPTLEKERLRTVARDAKQVIRHWIAPFKGTEFDKSSGIGIVFERPVDAVAYTLNVHEGLVRLSERHGLPLEARMGAHFGEVEVRGLSAGPGATPEVSGAARDLAHELMLKAETGRILLSRGCFDVAQATANGNETIPHGTEWIRLGRLPVGRASQLVDVCEVRLPPVGAAAAGAPGVRIKAALQMGAAAISHSLKGTASGPQKSLAPITAATAAGVMPKAADLLGTTLGGHRIEAMHPGELGCWCFVARDLSLDRDVLLKVLPPAVAKKDPEALKRFVREGLALRFLRHPNIAAIHDAGVDGGLYYQAGELVRGGTMQEMVEAAGPLEPRVALGYAIQIARALAAAHAAGIVHRDIQPASLMVSTQGSAKIVSMGLAKVRDLGTQSEMLGSRGDDAPILRQALENMTQMNTSLGNPQFTAREQLRNAATVDARADQYALGATLYYLLTGRPPYEGRGELEIQARQSLGPPKPLAEAMTVGNPPSGLQTALSRALSHAPEKRYATMGELVIELERVAGLRVDLSKLPPPDTATPKPTQSGSGTSAPPAPDHQSALTEAAVRYHAAPLRRLRVVARLGLALTAFVGLVLLLAFEDFSFGVGLLMVASLTPLFHVVLDGIFFKNPLFRRLMQLFARPSAAGVTVAVGSLLFTGLLLWLFGLVSEAGLAVLVSLSLAVGNQVLVLLPLRLQRSGSLRAVEEELRAMRQRGLSEESLQTAVFHAAPVHWEELYEQLFGYDAMIARRVIMGARGELIGKAKYAAWRDGLAAWLVEMEEAREEARAKRSLTEAETERMQLEGMGAEEARRRAIAEARRLYEAEREQQRRIQAVDLGAAGYPMHGAGYGPLRAAGAYAPGQGGPIRTAFIAIKTGLGSGILLAYMAPQAAGMIGLPIPPPVTAALATYYQWGMGGTYWAMLVGGAILSSARGGRYFTSTLACLGALMLVLTKPIVVLVDQPQFDGQMAVFCGMALLFVAFGMRRLTSASGMRMLLPF